MARMSVLHVVEDAGHLLASRRSREPQDDEHLFDFPSGFHGEIKRGIRLPERC